MPLSADAFVSASRPRRATCTVAKILSDLGSGDRKVLADALENADVTHSAIAAVLLGEGFKVNQGTIARHRRGGCACGS